ncbi:MAG: hypothetical protein R6X22_10445, partial [Gemmatimonadota bacterium]
LAARTAAAGALVLLSGAVLVANLRRATLFPVAQFLVGAGDERELRFARRRRWLLRAGWLATVLAVAGSLVSGLGT